MQRLSHRLPLVALAAALAAALVGASGSALAKDPNLDRYLAATCANCHGTDGHAVPGAGMAALAGMPRDTLRQKLADFKNGAKPATIMHQISKGYSDEQLNLITDYFAAQK